MVDYPVLIMPPAAPRLHLADHLRPGAHFYLERQRLATPPAESRLHRHAFLELFWVVSGQGLEHRLDQDHPLVPRSLVLLRPDDAHALSPAPGQALLFWNLAFPQADWQTLLARHRASLSDRFAAPATRRWQLSARAAAQLQDWADEAVAAGRRQLDLERLLLNLLHLLDQQAATATRPPPWLTAALETIRQPRWFVGGPRALARLCNRSAEHTARTVRHHLGLTPTEVVNQARLDWAADRLATSNDAIIDIAQACGWSNLGCFYRSFRRHCATTPDAWRRRARRIAGG